MWRDPAVRDAVILAHRDARATRPPPRWSTAAASPARTSSPRRPSCTRRYGGVVPEVASRRHLELVVAGGRARRSTEAGVTLDELDADRRHRGPGPDRRAAGRAGDRQGARYARGLPLDPGRPPARPHRRALPRSREPLEPPFLLPARLGRPHAAGSRSRTARGYRVHRHDARRRGRRGVRQGRAAARPGLPGRRRRSSGWRASGDPTRIAFPVAMLGRPGLDFSFSGAQDRAAATPCRGARTLDAVEPTWRPPTSARSCARWWAARRRRWTPTGQRPRWPWSAGWRRTARCAAAFEAPARERGVELALAPLELCSDNAAMIASAARYSRRDRRSPSTSPATPTPPLA